jgi:hypothetical protein
VSKISILKRQCTFFDRHSAFKFNFTFPSALYQTEKPLLRQVDRIQVQFGKQLCAIGGPLVTSVDASYSACGFCSIARHKSPSGSPCHCSGYYVDPVPSGSSPATVAAAVSRGDAARSDPARLLPHRRPPPPGLAHSAIHTPRGINRNYYVGSCS